MKRNLFIGFIMTLGFLLMGMAVFAREIRIDNNAEWGSKRILLFAIGCLIFLSGLLFPYLEQLALLAKKKSSFSRVLQDYWFILPAIAVVLIIYVWYVSAGLWTTWPPRTTYYTLLARAFQKHQLYLEQEPSEELLSLENPYDPSQRVGIGEPLDYSLYQGKFYLYWGPVPALILAMLGLDLPRNLPDLYLVFGFSFGLFLLLTMLVIFVWDRYFFSLPKWILVISVLLVGLSGPLVWIVCTAEIYEAAIVGGQFFLFAGFMTAVFTLEKTKVSDFTLILTGVFWALALGTRLTLILSIGFMMLMVAYMLWRSHSNSFGVFLRTCIMLGSPVAVGLAALAWYNWARFSSLSETGFTYQLAGTNLQKNLSQLFSHEYVIQNFYNYFLVPFQFETQFPFIYSNSGSIKSILPFYHLPTFYNTNLITGMVYVLPFLFFSIFHLISRKQGKESQATGALVNLPLAWIINTLSGSALIALIFLFVFFWAAMRYALEFSAMLLVVSITGYFRGYLLAKRSGWERGMSALGILVAAISILMSVVLAISGNIVLFQQVNPDLLRYFVTLGK